MTKTKEIASQGIAFSEKDDLKKLKKYAAQGWVVQRYKGMGYELALREPEDVDFCIDIQELAPGEEEEYFALFEFAGWEHVCSSYSTHLFKAAPGTPPIYSDNNTRLQKLERLQALIMPLFWMTFIAMVVSFSLQMVTSGIVGTVFNVAFVIFLILFGPCFAMVLSLTYRRARL